MIVFNNIIPFPGYKAIALWPFIFVRNKAAVRFTKTCENHENIHLRQQREMLVLGFYLWYLLEWVFRVVQYWSFRKGYKNISFEREAYANEGDLGYLNTRKRFAWIHYIKKR